MKLIATASNLLPADPTVCSVSTGDGAILRVAFWQAPNGRMRGTVCILQGRAEFIEKYFEVVSELRQRGFAVLAFDWRGQGGSSRLVDDPRKGYIPDFSCYLADLAAIAATILPDLPTPHYALAHSMGGAIALKAATEDVSPFVRQVICSPMLGLSIVPYPSLAAIAAKVLKTLRFGQSFVPGGKGVSELLKTFDGNRLTSDRARFLRNREAVQALGDWAIGSTTIDWLDAAFRQMRGFAVSGILERIETPTLIVAGGADPVCDTAVAQRLSSRLKNGKTIVIPGARHELLMESDPIRRQFWNVFDAFIPEPDTVVDESSQEMRLSGAVG